MNTHYRITIIGTGTHHQGHTTGNPERDADHHLKQIVQRLQANGHTIRAAAFQHADDAPEMILGSPEDLSLAGQEVTTPSTLQAVLNEVRAHHEDFRKFVAYEKREDQDDLKAPKPAKPRAKKEAAAPDVPKPPVETPASPPAPQEPQEQGNAENAPPLTSNSPQGDGNPTE